MFSGDCPHWGFVSLGQLQHTAACQVFMKHFSTQVIRLLLVLGLGFATSLMLWYT